MTFTSFFQYQGQLCAQCYLPSFQGLQFLPCEPRTFFFLFFFPPPTSIWHRDICIASGGGIIVVWREILCVGDVFRESGGARVLNGYFIYEELKSLYIAINLSHMQLRNMSTITSIVFSRIAVLLKLLA